MLFVNSLLAALILYSSVFQVSNADYVGAVAEHAVYDGTEGGSETNDFKLNKNIEIYEGLISLAAKHGVQVLVFPEFGLTPGPAKVRSDLYPFIESIPEVAANSTPCHDTSFNSRPILQRISCAAETSKQLVLINMIDNIACDTASDKNCPSDGHYQYNTDVMFNTAGQIVAKYHKSHEFPSLKSAYDQPLNPSQVTYKSSFGVEFGLFICYDIMFEDPAKVLRSRGIQHFLYAVSQGSIGESTIIEPWSKNNNATVLSANLGAGKKDCSGLIVNGTPLAATKYHLESKEFPEENILVASVPV